MFPERLTKSNPEYKVKISKEEFRRNLIMNIVFENFFVPAILRPAQYGIISGLAIDRRSRNNLIQVIFFVPGGEFFLWGKMFPMCGGKYW